MHGPPILDLNDIDEQIINILNQSGWKWLLLLSAAFNTSNTLSYYHVGPPQDVLYAQICTQQELHCFHDQII